MLKIGKPKNNSRNAEYKSDAPVFLTSPQEIMLFKGKAVDIYETDQMRGRVRYLMLSHAFEGSARVEVPPCGHCGARFYLEGRSPSGQPRESSNAPPALALEVAPRKRAHDVVNELATLLSLKAGGLIDSPEAKRLKDKLVAEA